MRCARLSENAKIFSLALRWAGTLVLIGAVCSIASPDDVGAQGEAAALRLPRLGGPITLDGESNEAAWAEIAPLPMTQHEPVFGAEPTERTEIRVAYDRENLYLAARLYDREPE